MDFLNFFGLLLIVSVRSVHSSCGTIFDRSTVQELNECMETFFSKTSTIPKSVWSDSLPTPEQKEQIHDLIRRIYLATNYTLHCDPSVILDYQYLLDVIEVTQFQDIYCVIHEPIPENKKYFSHFWGYVILRNPLNVTYPLHHSVAHFRTDGDVCNQAAYVFENTKSRSLVVAGAARDAVIGNVTSPCQINSYISDAAHDDRTMFHAFNVAIYDAAKALKNSCDFIQWHGMAETSCNNIQAYISAGAMGNATIYTDENAPVNRIRRSFNRFKYGAETPATDTCKLTAKTNVFGRYVNGVPLKDVCDKNSDDRDIRGSFVHIEQKRAVRDDWDLWVKVIDDAFSSSSVTFYPVYLLYICLLRSLYL